MADFGKFEYSRNTGLPLLIYGVGELARLAKAYFTEDSPYEVGGFIVDDEFMPESKTVFGLPVHSAIEIGKTITNDSHSIFVAFSGVGLSYPRTSKVADLKSYGFHLASYVSSYAFVASDAKIGENVMIFEHNTIQSEVQIGNASIIWSGNHVGHQTVIDEGAFISSHVCIGGRTKIGRNSYFGMNSTIRDQIELGPNSVVGSNSYVHKNFVGNGVIFGVPAKLMPTVDPFKAVN